jgi:hypothetical protein
LGFFNKHVHALAQITKNVIESQKDYSAKVLLKIIDGSWLKEIFLKVNFKSFFENTLTNLFGGQRPII